MKLGIMGGTFDPIHLGHLRAAETVREALALDQVVFVPSRLPPHRREPVASALDRYAMVALATAGNRHFVVSDLELVREGPSYTVDTLRALGQQRPADALIVILGSDAWAELPSWKDVERVLSLCTLAVVGRPEATAAPPPSLPGARVEHVVGPLLALSATAVRDRIREGGSICYLVPEAVADHIGKRGLYR